MKKYSHLCLFTDKCVFTYICNWWEFSKPWAMQMCIVYEYFDNKQLLISSTKITKLVA
jgi:hypothetical protein